MSAIKQKFPTNILIKMKLSTDHTTGATGKTLSVMLIKNGAAPVALSAAAVITERGYGWYNILLGISDCNTLGDLVLIANASGCDESTRTFVVYTQVEDARNPITRDNPFKNTRYPILDITFRT